MIIRHLQIKDPSKENLHHLIKYQENGKENIRREERVLYTGTGNCIGEDAFAAEAEMKILAYANKRVKKSEHFAHLIFSPSPEDPALSHEQWKEIINQTLKELHMQDHQYFYYVHKDTDQEHMHLVINRINPDTLKWNDMSFDYRIFQELGTRFEEQLNLKQVNHETKYTREQSQANDLERKSGQQSFFNYVFLLRNELLQAKSWDEFHQVCSEHNISVLKKGRGIVFTTEFENKTIGVKASGIDRDLSLSKLTRRLGDYTEAKDIDVEKKSTYEAKPVGYSTDETQLNNVYETYRILQEHNQLQRKLLLAQETERYKKEKNKLKIMLKDMQKNAYFEFKKNQEALTAEKDRIELLKKQLYKELETEHRKKISEIRKQTRTMRFQDYLRRYQDSINPELSRELLQSRAGAKNSQGINQIYGENLRNNLSITETLFFRVVKRTTKGTDIFSSAVARGDLIRDNGKTLTLNQKPSLVTVADALNLALERFGKDTPLKINGSSNFQRQCVLIAIQNNIKLEINDPKVNEYYKQLQEKVNDRRNRDFRSVSGHGSSDRRERSIRRAGAEYRARRRAAFRDAIRGDYNGSFATARSIGETGSIHNTRFFFTGTKSERKDQFTSSNKSFNRQSGNAAQTEHVSDLSSRNLARNREQQSEQAGMLLHGNDAQKLEFSKSKGEHNKLRQGLSDSNRELNKQPQQKIDDRAAIRYMNERNEKRKTIQDILEHRIWSENDIGEFKFAGIRNLDNKPYILLRKDNIIYIKITSEYEKKRLSNAGLESDVEIRKDGKVIYRPQQKKEDKSFRRK